MRASRTKGLVRVAICGLFAGLDFVNREVKQEVAIVPGNSFRRRPDVPRARRGLLKRTLGFVDHPTIQFEDCCPGIKERHPNRFGNVAPTNWSDGRIVILRGSHIVVISGLAMLNETSGHKSEGYQRNADCGEDDLAVHILTEKCLLAR